MTANTKMMTVKEQNKALSQTSVMVSADYKGYRIDQDRTGFAPKNMVFHFWIDDGENVAGFGESVEDCKEQIDEIIYLNE